MKSLSNNLFVTNAAAASGATVIGTGAGETLEGFDYDTSTGLFSDDLIDGRGGKDYLYGHAGNDTLIGGKGRDYMAGGDGDDTYILRAGDGAKNAGGTGVYEAIGFGTDTIRIEGIAAGDLRIWGDAGGYSFSIGSGNGSKPGVEFVSTSYLADGGSDFWRRYEAIEFDDGTVWTAATGLRLIGSNQGQTSGGTDLGDLIEGRGGKDYLYGHGGNDTLIGGKGRDYMAGGDGDDTYILRAGDGAKNAGGTGVYEEIGAGTDTIRIEGIAAGDLRIWGDGGGYSFSIGSGNGSKPGVEFVSTSYLADGSSDFWRRYEAIEFDDGTVWTAATGLRLIGSNQGQTSGGTDLGDFIDGHGGNDYLYGYGGNDTMMGGAGNDYLDGGYGHDTFVYAAGMDEDTVWDFTPGQDKIDVSGFAGVSEFSDLLPFLSGTYDTVIAFSATDRFILSGVDQTALSGDDFLF